MNVAAIIPARFGSTRFPGKPLALIHGKSMIQRVYEQAKKCPSLAAVLVATDDERIAATVEDFGGEVVMTASTHQSGTERCAEAVQQFPSSIEAIVNIQGDEPFIHPHQVEMLCSMLQPVPVQIATLVKQISRPEQLFDPNVVKVVITDNQEALYFSRAAIPFYRNAPEQQWLRLGIYYQHVGIYGYRRTTLENLVALPPHVLEKAESLEQLRWLAHGFRIHVSRTEEETISVDTPDDLLRAERNFPGL